MTAFCSLLPWFFKYRYRLVIGIFFVTASGFFAVLAPQITGYVVDVAIAPDGEIDTRAYSTLVRLLVSFLDHLSTAYIVLYCSLSILAVAFMRGLLMYAMRQTLVVMSRHIEYDQKNALFKKYLSLDMSFYQEHSIGDMMSRISEDIGRVRMLMGPSVMYIFTIVTIAGLSIYYMWQKHSVLTLYVLLPLPILSYLIYRVSLLVHLRSMEVQTTLAASTAFVRNAFAGIRVVQSFHQEKAMQLRFEEKTAHYCTSSLRLAKVQSLFTPLIGAVISLSVAATLLVGGIYFIEGTVSMGTLTEFIMYLNTLVFPITSLGWVTNIVQRALASQQRINEFMKVDSTLKSGKLLPSSIGEVVFDRVSFRYPDKQENALSEVSFTIKAGQKVAIVGMIGSGKTTVAQLLLRFCDPKEGNILFAGKEVSAYEIKYFRSNIAYASQDVFLFSGSIIDNLRLGNPSLSEEEACHLLTLVDLLSDVDTLPDKLNTIIGEKGVTLSGGQQQRLSIARALATDSYMVVLDDCFSAIDTHTESIILSNIQTLCAEKTLIIISHRYTVMPDMDNILVFHAGCIVEQGTHNSLLAKEGHYFDIYHSISKEEVDAELLPKLDQW